MTVVAGGDAGDPIARLIDNDEGRPAHRPGLAAGHGRIGDHRAAGACHNRAQQPTRRLGTVPAAGSSREHNEGEGKA